MDISNVRPETEVTYEIETTGKPITLWFKVRFIAADAMSDSVRESINPTGPPPRLSEVVRKVVSEAIIDWDLTDGDTPIPCTKENKDKYLPLIFGLTIKNANITPEDLEADPAAATVVRSLANFAGTAENFLKN